VKLDEIQPDMKFLVMGQSGTGKTHLVGTLAELMPTVIVTADIKGLTTLKRMQVKPETEIIRITDWDNIWSDYQAISSLSKDYLALAIDDLSRLEELSRDRVEYMPRTAAESRMSKTEFQAYIREQLMLGDRSFRPYDWGITFLGMDNFLNDCLKLPYKVILLTCLESEYIHQRTGQPHIYPALQKATRDVIHARVSEVYETFIAYDSHNKPIYCAHCHPHPKIQTKTRQGNGRTWINPTMQKFINHVVGGKDDVETELEKRIGVGV
jgi:energy-coupling factor transporter ATP-binding protein EcfA2